jgi:hypothetical protein
MQISSQTTIKVLERCDYAESWESHVQFQPGQEAHLFDAETDDPAQPTLRIISGTQPGLYFAARGDNGRFGGQRLMPQDYNYGSSEVTPQTAESPLVLDIAAQIGIALGPTIMGDRVYTCNDPIDHEISQRLGYISALSDGLYVKMPRFDYRGLRELTVRVVQP